jgi:hypothetical protein
MVLDRNLLDLVLVYLFIYPFYKLHSSRFSNQASSRALQSTGMDTASTTVPSIVVYVTVPNREAGWFFFLVIIIISEIDNVFTPLLISLVPLA